LGIADQADQFVAEVRRWLRAARYGPPWLPPAIAGMALLGLFGLAERLPLPARDYVRPVLLLAGIACLGWSVWQISRRPLAPAPPEDLEKPPALKGAASFGPQDARLFSRLGRTAEVKTLAAQVHNDQVPLIVVYGESGLGKTSLLRAGLEGGADPARLRVIYWEASPTDPAASLLHAAAVQWGDRQGAPASLDDLLLAGAGEPAVLVVDQAEQLSPEHHAPIFGLLAKAASSLPPYRLTWIVAFRRSYMATWRDFELSLPKAALARLEYLPLKPFNVKTATEVVSVLVEESGLPIESSVVDAVVRGVVDDGKVSPVDIGISLLAVSELAAGQSSLSVRQYLDAGGLTALLRTYLDGLLERFSPREREELGRALLRLVDLAADKRIAEGLTAAALLDAAPGMRPPDFVAALDFLASPKARVLEVLPATDPPRYRLVHERLIPAVRRLAGPILVGQEQARLALDRAFTMWTLEGGTKYLLSGRSLKQVRANAEAMQLGDAGSEKRKFLALSRRRYLLHTAALAAGALVVLVAAAATPRFLQSQRSAAARDASFDAWDLPRDLYQRVRQLQSLGLSGKVNSLTWLDNARSLSVLDVTGSEIANLQGLPNTVRTLKLSRPYLLQQLPAALHEVGLDLSLSLYMNPNRFLSQIPPSVTSLSLKVSDFAAREVLLDQLPPAVGELSLTLVQGINPSKRPLGIPPSAPPAHCVTSLHLISQGDLQDLARLPPWARLVELSANPQTIESFFSGGASAEFELPGLPASLRSLEFAGKLKSLAGLPPGVTSLTIQSIPHGAVIPESVKHLGLIGGAGDLVELRALPRSITSLYLDLTNLRIQEPGFAALAPSVRRLALTLRQEQAALLRQLPASVESLALNMKFGGPALPELPRSLTALNIANSEITTLSGLPASLLQLVVRPDQLRTLEGLPGSVRALTFNVTFPDFREAPARRGTQQ
jgi:hypothetical protein